jgi:serine protease AprX
VAGGNDGNAALLRNPAINPFVIAVGSANNSGGSIDGVSTFTSCGTSERYLDILAPGQSLVSLRNPGSHADETHPEAALGNGYFLGSGSSQATAVVAGATALLLDQRPELTPDQVKQILTHESADYVNGVDFKCQGAGALNLSTALNVPTPSVNAVDQTYQESAGTGTLEGARGSLHVYDDGLALDGETDIMSNPWTPYDCTTTATGKGKDKVTTTTCDSKWAGGDYNGTAWTGGSWSGGSWSGGSWSGTTWSGTTWSGGSWSAKTWSDASWSGGSWSGGSWSGGSWSGGSWSGGSWSGDGWLWFTEGLSWD